MYYYAEYCRTPRVRARNTERTKEHPSARPPDSQRGHIRKTARPLFFKGGRRFLIIAFADVLPILAKNGIFSRDFASAALKLCRRTFICFQP